MSESANRVVAYIRPDLISVLDKCRNDKHNGCAEVWMRPVDETYVALVPEQLLVEAEKDRDEWERVACYNGSDVNRLLKELEEAESKLAAVQALADELEARGRAYWTHPNRETFAARLRALGD